MTKGAFVRVSTIIRRGTRCGEASAYVRASSFFPHTLCELLSPPPGWSWGSDRLSNLGKDMLPNLGVNVLVIRCVRVVS
ncbi:hypothetical protein TIFTF001_017278 [Ficus carica]|uniref:Uncharacterized protein n=1 Tax=Ficus carica TaxID=3494 RepID=A0AA88A4P8_FICCA|nr:hypothetical protein TIFTF001_017278 [Ficus carica]